jgi:hypothetical protein
VVIVAGFFGVVANNSLLEPGQSDPLVVDEGFQAGHQTVGINEKAIEKGANTLLFSTLKNWKYRSDNAQPHPDSVAEYDERNARITGFMYPLKSGRNIRSFCLLRSTQTCCYGPKPQFNQFVLVEMAKPVPFERLRPVMVEGEFFVDPQPEDGYIYRMEGKSTVVAKR